MWTIIEECLNPPVVWEKARAVGSDGGYDVEAEFFTLPPFSEPGSSTSPRASAGGSCVSEEVLLMPALGRRREGDLQVRPRRGDDHDPAHAAHPRARQHRPGHGQGCRSADVVAAACCRDPATIGAAGGQDLHAGLWVTGTGKDGMRRRTYLYHVSDNADTMRDRGAQCVVWQTAIQPVVALGLLANGTWSGAGVLGGGLRRRAVPRPARRAEAAGLRLPWGLGPLSRRLATTAVPPPITAARTQRGHPHGVHPEVARRVRSHPSAHRGVLAGSERWRAASRWVSDPASGAVLTTCADGTPRRGRARRAGSRPRGPADLGGDPAPASAARSCAGPSTPSSPARTSSPP